MVQVRQADNGAAVSKTAINSKIIQNFIMSSFVLREAGVAPVGCQQALGK